MEWDKLKATILSGDTRQALETAFEELVASTMLAIRQDPRAHGFVTLKEHDARAAELLNANSGLVERARDAEHKLEAAMSLLNDIALGKGHKAAA